jgi:hypothetical protein
VKETQEFRTESYSVEVGIPPVQIFYAQWSPLPESYKTKKAKKSKVKKKAR